MSKQYYNMETGVPGVRLATQNDEAQIFALLLLLHAENGLFGVNHDKVLTGIRCATERRGGIIYVIEEDKWIVATLGMVITQDWYSDDEYLLERWNYVHPDYRRSDYARKLLEQAKWASEWFRQRGKLMPFQCGINSFDRTEAKIRLYARHMPCIGAFFLFGQTPRQADKVAAEMKRIEEANVRSSRIRRKEVVSHVETIIRMSR